MAVKIISQDCNGNVLSERLVNDGETILIQQSPPPKSGDTVSNNNVTVIPLNKAFIAIGTFLLIGGLIWLTGHVRYLWLLWLLVCAV